MPLKLDGKTAEQIAAEAAAIVASTSQSDEITQTAIDPGKIKIDVSIQHLPTLNDLCWQAIKRENGDAEEKESPRLFTFAGQMVRAAIDEDGALQLQPITAPILRNQLSLWANWHSWKVEKGDGGKKQYVEVPAKPPKDVIEDVLASASPQLPPLRRIVNAPVFSSDGEIDVTPGYNWKTGIYYQPSPGFKASPLPDLVTPKDVAQAKAWLEDILVDFPFAEPAGPEKANAIAFAILPFAREMIPGATPNHLFEAPQQSSGKSLLAQVLAGIGAGDEVGLISPTREDEEWRKRITSALMRAKPVIIIDNVIHDLQSEALAAAWTALKWEDRPMRTNDWVSLPIRCAWATTANNMIVSNDLSTRLIRIRLAPATARPEDRDAEKFNHPDLPGYCRENRAALVWAIHILIKNWVQRGQPKPTNIQVTRYSDWCRVIGGIMQAAGFNDFLANQRTFQSAGGNTEALARAAFCDAWRNWAMTFHAERMSVPDIEAERKRRLTKAFASELLALARNIEDFPLPGRTPEGQAKEFGKWLQTNRDARIEYDEEEVDGQIRSERFRIQRHGSQVQGKRPWRLCVESLPSTFYD